VLYFNIMEDGEEKERKEKKEEQKQKIALGKEGFS
jgi:hypothetical protein